MAATIGLLASRFRSRWWRSAIILAAGGAIVYYGTVSALQKGGYHRWVWERYRMAMTRILRIAPEVEPDTVIVLTGVPRDSDPFGDNYWFDMAVRLAYPGVRVAGILLYADGTPAPGDNWTVEGPVWHWDGTGFQRLFHATPVGKTLVIEYHASGADTLKESLPAALCRGACPDSLYRPSIHAGPVSPIAVRRFRL
jgi:hypothetical protein